nr:MAG TPA: hypothetical protein [Caudoviricetes sp.]
MARHPAQMKLKFRMNLRNWPLVQPKGAVYAS